MKKINDALILIGFAGLMIYLVVRMSFSNELELYNWRNWTSIQVITISFVISLVFVSIKELVKAIIEYIKENNKIY